jgi:cyclic pyranopterin phosphate synthase
MNRKTNSTEIKLSHINQHGEAHMVDIANKKITARVAIAQAKVIMQKATLQLVLEDKIKKGDVLSCARIAGIMAAKKTAELIPMCHPIALEGIEINLQTNKNDELGIITIETTCKTTDKTGIEMEALTATSIAALTIYDMCKSYDRGMQITDTHLCYKTGGKSGEFLATSS